MSNYTGITPLLNRVLIKPMFVTNVSAGGIIIATDDMSEREQLGNTTGEVIEVGPDAFKEEGYDEPPVKPGDKIIMAKYAGLMYVGRDGKKYRMINHDDITGLLDPDMELVDPHLVKGLK
jgi:co-chaperonin GroES (HSP10)